VNQHTFDTFTRDAAFSRRHSLVTLGGAALAATFGGATLVDAGKKNRNKRKKKCNRQKTTCREIVAEFCADFGDDAPACEAVVLPCCATCNIANGMRCAIEVFSPMGM
jgi:hypothetical protein